MWIVRLALRRPYTFVILAMLVAGLGSIAALRMRTDVLPDINIPVVSVIWSYNGLPAQEMERRMVLICERAMTTTVNSIEHIESQSFNGLAVIRLYFQPDVKVEGAVAQVTAINQTLLRIMPPGTGPPLISQYSASDVPILQAVISSNMLPETILFDQGQNFIRTPLTGVQGAQVLLPAGGKPRSIMVDLDLPALYAKGFSPADVSTAINNQNVILPTGDIKLGATDYSVHLNSSPEAVEDLNNVPLRPVNGVMVYLRDVAHVRDGYSVQQNIVRADGKRAALIPILKSTGASTLDIVSRVRAIMPRIKAALPPGLNVDLLFDQSTFVRASIKGVLIEGTVAGCLTALMILLFLGSVRSTIIVATSIPLSILTSILVLDALGQTLNLMTLGGMALAVGILVDDATVEIENIHRNLGENKPLRKAILDGAQQIAVPAFVATACICIVFTPVVFIAGAARFLFIPLAMAVVFAVFASYLLSRTIVPTMVLYLLPTEVHLHQGDGGGHGASGPIWRVHLRFEKAFEKARDRYQEALGFALHNPRLICLGFGILCVVSLCLFPFLGRDFFPAVDAGQIRVHVRTPAGTRLEETERRFGLVEGTIRHVIQSGEIEHILDNIGLPIGGVNSSKGDSATVSFSDGEILVSLKEGMHGSTAGYVKQLRRVFATQYPDMTFFFQPADIVGQTLNFGLPAAIDVQVTGPLKNQIKNYEVARQLEAQIKRVEGAVDVHMQQVVDAPQLGVSVDRTRASQAGLTQRDVASNLLISLSGSGQSAPNYWLDPKSGVNYSITVQTPPYRLNSMESLRNTPIIAQNGSARQLLTNLATVARQTTPVNISHYNIQPVYDIEANLQDRDLAAVSGDIQRIIDAYTKKLPPASTINMRGQVENMNASYRGLSGGLIFAIVLVYCLMVVNFQSWIDPLIIITGLPGALCGILWMLFITQTTLSIPALMGTIMCVGVATANSILLVTFANDQRREGSDAIQAALEAGFTRLRPVIMTALAMIIGMLPMSLGLSEGGEQNAPLGRAVIGGLLFATPSTLFFVPVMYSLWRRKAFVDPEEVADREEAEQGIELNGHHHANGHAPQNGQAPAPQHGQATVPSAGRHGN